MTPRRVKTVQIFGLCAVVSALAGAAAHPVFAQSLTDRAAEQAEKLLQRQSIEQLNQDLQRIEQQSSAPNNKAVARPDLPGSKPGDACIQIDTISVQGATLISEEAANAAVKSWEGKCVGLAEMDQVLQSVTYLYIQRGYIASRAYLEEQDLSDGSLEITVVEGQLQTVLADDTNPIGDTELAMAFPGMVGNPVNLRDVEQGLDQINRLSSNDATIQLDAGEELGDSTLKVANKTSRPWHVSFTVDNLGSPSNGLYRSGASLTLDNILHLNDQWTFSYQRSMNNHPLFFNSDLPNSNAVEAGVSIPYGYWTAGLDFSWSNYHSTLAGFVVPIETSGRSISVSPYVSRVLHRDQTSKTLLTGRLRWKSTDNYFLGNLIDLQSRSLTIASLDLTHSRQLWGGQASFSAGYDQGLKLFGAFDDSTAPPGSAKGQFSRHRISAAYLRAQDLGNDFAAIYNGSLQGQWSPHSLFASEQIALGGYSTVRGARESVLYGRAGIFARNDLSLLLPAPKVPALIDLFGRLEPYVAIDAGYALPEPSGDGLHGTLVGGAVGLRNRGGKLNFDVSYSDILLMPQSIRSANSANTGLVQATLSISF